MFCHAVNSIKVFPEKILSNNDHYIHVLKLPIFFFQGIILSYKAKIPSINTLWLSDEIMAQHLRYREA